MNDLLYLDTARIGRMSSAAKIAHHGFAELVGEEGGSAYFERFLRCGLDGLPTDLQSRYPGLAGWRGIAFLKESLRHLAGEHSDSSVLFANRSAQLMKLAARSIFHTCRNVLATDLDWPCYSDILSVEAQRANRIVTVIPVRRAITNEGMGEEALVARIRSEYRERGCDSLFLTALSSDGIRQPVGRIVREVESVARVWFVAVDGAQDFCHVGADLSACDLYLTGAHKWLGAGHPLGIGLYGRRRSKGRIEDMLSHMLGSGDLDDPLSHFTNGLAEGAMRPSETVSLAPLFSCQGAACDALSARKTQTLADRIGKLEIAAELSVGSAWRPVLTDKAFRCGILVLRNEEAKGNRWSADEIRLAFRERGVALSAYQGGTIRLSMPETPWSGAERDKLRDALRNVGTT